MHDNIENMINDGQLIEIHPGAEADIPAMNELLKSQDDYIEGLEFIYTKKLHDNSAQFYYDHPDSFTLEQEIKAKEIVLRVKEEFLNSKNGRW